MHWYRTSSQYDSSFIIIINAESISEFRQSQLFQVNQEQVYKELNGEKQSERIIRNSEDSIKFSSNILSIRKKHNRHAKWLKDCRKQFESVSSMGKVEISKDMVKVQCRKMSKSSWKIWCARILVEKPYIID